MANVRIDDSQVLPTHQVEIVKSDGSVVREPAMPKAFCVERVAALNARKPAGVKVVRVVPAKR